MHKTMRRQIGPGMAAGFLASLCLVACHGCCVEPGLLNPGGFGPGGCACGSAVPLGYHNHPRFHPVPVRPVFSPSHAPLFASDELASPEEIPPGASMEEAVDPGTSGIPPGMTDDVPPLDDQLEDDRQGQVPQRLGLGSDSSSWMFAYPPVRPTEPASRQQVTGQGPGRDSLVLAIEARRRRSAGRDSVTR